MDFDPTTNQFNLNQEDQARLGLGGIEVIGHDDQPQLERVLLVANAMIENPPHDEALSVSGSERAIRRKANREHQQYGASIRRLVVDNMVTQEVPDYLPDND